MCRIYDPIRTLINDVFRFEEAFSGFGTFMFPLKDLRLKKTKIITHFKPIFGLNE